MKLVTEALPLPVQSGIQASADFQHPLQQLETYVTRSQNPKLADSFRKFKEALSDPDAGLLNTATAPSAQPPSTVNNKPQPEERSYLAMSSLFTINVKQW